MITGIDLNETKEYSSPRDKKDPTIWIIGALGSDETGKFTLGGQPGWDQVTAAAQRGIRGWKNFKDVKGVDIPFASKEGKVPMELLRLIPPIVLIEIGSEILKISRLSEDETKN